MTGFGKATQQLPEKKITIEVKTLNSKTLDLNVRVPSFYREKEIEIRKKISERLVRGKIDFIFFSELTGVDKSQTINTEIVKSYIAELKNIVPTENEVELLKIAMQMPDATSMERNEINEEEWKEIQQIIDNAIDATIKFREDEGKMLVEDFKLRIGNIGKLLQEIAVFEPIRMEQLKQRLREKLEENVGKSNIDENRFEQELIFYLEKLDVSEEKIRLQNHLDYFLAELEASESNGKKLGFITQEIGREINTLGSKSNLSEMQKIVVQMKDELEKIKEQVLNAL